jgi:hypothetical protein
MKKEDTQLFEIKIMVISERKNFIRIPTALADEWDYKIALEALKGLDISIHDFEIISEYLNEESLEISPSNNQNEDCRVIIPNCDFDSVDWDILSKSSYRFEELEEVE